jgi:hypothetical protein
LNRRPFDYQSNAPAVLSYRPFAVECYVVLGRVYKNFRKCLNAAYRVCAWLV